MRGKKVLLIEPNYKNKYPPIGLMKLATYHKMIGYNVVFFKGEFNDFIINELAEEAIKKIAFIEKELNWNSRTKLIKDFIKRRNYKTLEKILEGIILNRPSITEWLKYYNSYYNKKEYLKNPEWDRICITTLFTFYWDKTISTINYFKHLCKSIDQVYIGGVLASLKSKEIMQETGLKTHIGLLDVSGLLDDNDIIIDELPLDYSILEEIDYKYPENGSYYGYMTRGCTRKCPFCAVPKLEPFFKNYIPLKNTIDETRRLFGEHRNLLLLDNNVLASSRFKDIISEIIEAGFSKNATYIEPNQLEIIYQNLKKGINDKGYIKKFYNLIIKLQKRIRGSSTDAVNSIIRKYNFDVLELINKKDILKTFDELNQIYEKYRNKTEKARYIDFNQGVDARYLNEENIKLLTKVPINPLRIAFDDMKYYDIYTKAVRLSAKNGINHLSNYLLYNFKDKPTDLYQRLKLNIELSEELDIDIYSFPMKYIPIDGIYSKNRDFIGVYWNRKFIRAIQAILNATKGKIGRGQSFFEEAFGKNEIDFEKLLWMPETLIIHRFHFKENGIADEWWSEFSSLSGSELDMIKKVIISNNFTNLNLNSFSENIANVLSYYLIPRADIKKQIIILDDSRDIESEKDDFEVEYSANLLPFSHNNKI
jgi:hypothetical protein